MTTIQVTITTPASGPFNVLKLLEGDTYAGAVTIVPTPAAGPPVVPATPPRIANQLVMQGDAGNSTNTIYWGDENLAANGAGGHELAAGVYAPALTDVPLSGVFVSGSSGSPKVVITAQGGFN